MAVSIAHKPPLEIRIDKLGRVVIPQSVRDALHLQPGTKLMLHLETDHEIVLKVVEEEPEVVYKNGWPVIVGELSPNFDTTDFINEERESRSLEQAGMNKK